MAIRRSAGGGALWTEGDDGSGAGEEELLLVRAATDADAFAEFYDRRQAQVLRYFVGLSGSHQDAAELHAETFAQALAHVDQFDPERGTAGAWLYTIATNQFRKFQRAGVISRRYREQEELMTPSMALDESERAAEVADAQVLTPHLLRAMGGLSEALRSAVWLRVAHDLPYREVAERLGVTEGTARIRVTRGLRHLRVALVAVLVAIALLVGVGAVAPFEDAATADVVVRIDDHDVVVTLEDLEHRADRIEAAVREAGLDVSVVAVPVGPSRVGRFLGQGSSGPLPPELRWVDQGPDGSRGFVLPVGWPGTLHLLVGAPAGADQPYAVFSDALRPGEPLACRDVLGHPARELAAQLADGDPELDVRWEAQGPDRNRPVPARSIRTGPEGAWVVVGVEATSRTAIVVRLAPPDDGPPDAGATARSEGCPR